MSRNDCCLPTGKRTRCNRVPSQLGIPVEIEMELEIDNQIEKEEKATPQAGPRENPDFHWIPTFHALFQRSGTKFRARVFEGKPEVAGGGAY